MNKKLTLQKRARFEPTGLSIYDVYLKNNGVHISGIIATKNKKRKIDINSAFQYAPENTSEVYSITPDSSHVRMIFDSLSNEHYFWIGNEMTQIITDQDTILMVKIAENTNAEYALEEVNLSASAFNNPDSLNTQKYSSQVLRKNYRSKFYNKRFHAIDDQINVRPQWFTVMNEAIFWAASPEILKKYIDQRSKGEILSEQKQFSDMYSHYNVKNVSKTYYADHQSRDSSISIIEALITGRQFATFSALSDNEIISNLFTQQKKQLERDISGNNDTLWKIHLPKITKIQKSGWFYNHRTDLYNLLIQNQDNLLYCINEQGKLRWKVEMESKINSDFQMVDLYRNDKNQIAFHTEKQIYILDVLGRNVNDFPVTTSAAITSPLALLDYDNDGSFRIFAGLKNGHVVNYNKDGALVDGWNFERGNTAIVSPVIFTSFNNYDYLHFIDEKGKLYATGRRGKDRLKKDIKMPNFKYQGCSFTKAGEWITSSYEYLTNEGSIYQVYMNNKADSSQLEKTQKVKVWDFNLPADNDKLYWLTTTPGSISIFSKLGIKNLEFSTDVSTVSHLKYVKRQQSNFGFLDVQNKKVYLLDKFGNVNEGYPMNGSKGLWFLDQFKRKTPLIMTFDKNFLYCKSLL